MVTYPETIETFNLPRHRLMKSPTCSTLGHHRANPHGGIAERVRFRLRALHAGSEAPYPPLM